MGRSRSTLAGRKFRQEGDGTDKLRLIWLTKALGASKTLESIGNEAVEKLIGQKLKETWQGRKISQATANRTMAALSTVLNSARKWGWVATVPYIRHLNEPRKRTRFLTREEVVRLIAELPQNLAEIAAFAILTGLRENNILDLQWRDVDLSRCVCWVHADEAKGKKAISVPLSTDAVSVLQMRIGHSQPFGPLTRVSNHGWYDARDRAGLSGLRFHDLRHTWASWHTMNGTPRSVLQELGGWSDSRMVERYAHLSPGFLANYVDNGIPASGTKPDTGTSPVLKKTA